MMLYKQVSYFERMGLESGIDYATPAKSAPIKLFLAFTALSPTAS